MDKLLKDLVSALRFIRRRRGFALLVVLCLALGIGVNSAIFSVVDALLLRSLPYKDADRLVVLLDIHQGPGSEPAEYSASSPNFVAWREQNRVFSQLEAMETKQLNLTGGGEPERVDGAAVTAGFFDLLGAKALLGRTFRADEDSPQGPPVVLLSDGLWRRRFGADPGILDKPLTLDGKPYTVIGILQPDFHFLQKADLWMPLRIDPANPPQPQMHYLFVAARLKPGVDMATARSEMNVIASRLARDNPTASAGWTVKVVGLRENLVGDLRHNVLVLLAAVAFVLLIACANVGNLLLTRATEQQSEIAVRAAFGASRTRLVRQALTESVVLAVLGGAVGLVFAKAALLAVPLLGSLDATLRDGIRIDLRVLVFTLLVSLLTGLLPGLLAATRVSRPDLFERLREAGRRMSEGVEGRRLQGLLVIAEVALAFVLLVCAGLTIRSFVRLSAFDPGFDPDHVLTMQISLPDSKYSDVSRAAGFWRELIRRVEALPGVVAAGATTALPVNDFAVTTIFSVENRAPASPGEVLMANFRRITPGYFRTLGIPLRSGRVFTEADYDKAPPVAVVSESMARRYWPGTNPIGRRIQRAPDAASGRWLTVVGVVGDIEDSKLGADFGSTFYVPIAQGARPTMNLVVRTSVAPLTLAAAVRREVLGIDSNQPVDQVTTLDEWVSRSLAKHRFSTLMLTLFALLGITLAVIGIYGVLSYSVSRRSHEIGVRMALGARAADVVRLILWRGLALTLIGLAIGLGLTLVSVRLLAELLYEIKPTDPGTFLGIAIGLTAVALAASYLPARRASRLDPIISLRSE